MEAKGGEGRASPVLTVAGRAKRVAVKAKREIEGFIRAIEDNAHGYV
jgi:hypothetical protein